MKEAGTCRAATVRQACVNTSVSEFDDSCTVDTSTMLGSSCRRHTRSRGRGVLGLLL